MSIDTLAYCNFYAIRRASWKAGCSTQKCPYLHKFASSDEGYAGRCGRDKNPFVLFEEIDFSS